MPTTIDQRLQDVRADLEAVRKERSTASVEYKLERLTRGKDIYIATQKVAKLVKRGRDAGVYNRAIQDLHVAGSNSMPQPFVLQRQAMLLQMLHKTDIYVNQIKVIERHSNKTVNYMMCEASVIETEQRELEQELMTKQGEFMNASLELEQLYHQRKQVQKTVMHRLNDVFEDDVPTSCHNKFDDCLSVDTMDTISESGFTASPISMRSMSTRHLFGKMLTLYS